ncbi:MAG TPA: FGGY family carbohydrate kinase [Jiangellales bacterium]|nr:FGGY family carbohydrate kinase [Jiangellales bacterium]
MVTSAYLGIDVGTSGLKVVLVRDDGRLLGTATETYPILTAAPGRVEADPRQWIAAAERAISRMSSAVAGVKIRAVGVSGQMHGLALCDGSGRPVAPAILWPDRRAIDVLGLWRGLPAERLGALANPIVPGMTGPMLSWLAEHRPDVVDLAAVALLAKDVVRHALTSHPVVPLPPTDRSDASATLLWDLPGDTWAEDVAAAVRVPTRLLPVAVLSRRQVGRTDWLSRMVPGGTRDAAVAAGAGDTPAALLAVGPAGLHINLGTGAQVIVRRPAANREGAHGSTHLYADAADGWYAMAALQNGGLALEHAARLLDTDWEGFITAAVKGRPGAVSFLPFLTGERGGVATPASLGGWLGVGLDSTREDLARAAAEGVLFAIRRGAELLGEPASGAEITLSGGGWRSSLLVRLAADVLDRPVRRVRVPSASAVGAAILAAQCVGEDLVPERPHDSVIEPAGSSQLEDAYQRWLERSGSV